MVRGYGGLVGQARGPGVRVLGTAALERDGQPVAVPSARQRALLAVLASAGGEPVRDDALIDAVWGDRLPVSPAGALRTQLSRLRKLIGDDAALARAPRGHALRVERSGVDAWEFEDRVGRARGEEPAPRAELLSSALALWRGRAFAEVADRELVQPVAARLEGLRLRAAEDLAEAWLEAGRHGEAVASLEALTAEEPLRERAVALLMRGLYAAGRPSEALDRFQEHRRRLAAELGLTPSPASRLPSSTTTWRRGRRSTFAWPRRTWPTCRRCPCPSSSAGLASCLRWP
ncbi:MAG: hypothetical protein GEV08_10485 [Acidimicrobiia bacterium]|nr:hypothetical protein [Acidimicrobiia bacterium]